MYKKFFMGIAAMAALTLVSCSSDDLNSLSDNSSKNEAISFDGYLGRSAVSVNGTRGSELTKDALQKLTEGGFGVFGNYSKDSEGATHAYGKNWFDNQKVTFSSGAWTYEPLKYWLPEGHIDFLAYAPYDAKNTAITDFKSKIDFSVDKEIDKQKDLLWANTTNRTKADKTVTFNFKHALAKIGYTVKTNVVGTGTTITLNKITLAGSAPKDPLEKAFYTKGTIDLSKTSSVGLWASPDPNDPKQNFVWVSTDQPLSSDKVIETPKDKYLFVIPQNFTGTDELYVIVDYTINYNTGVQSTMESTVSSKLTKNFEQGKAYKINLTVGLTPIQFDAEVDDWGNIDDNPITWN